MLSINENIYGHKNRLDWIKKHITKEKKGLEFGCGTGVMITGVLLQEGYDIEGVDLDKSSIDLGKSIYKKNKLDSNRLMCNDIKKLPDGIYDYIIASEVLEHITDDLLDEVIEAIKKKITTNGILLVTVPNGYGWFEFEDMIWKGLRLNSIFRFFKLYYFIERFKKIVIGYHYTDCIYPSSIAHSPHVQRFTLKSIIEKVKKSGFDEISYRGSTMVSGPFSNIFFTGFKRIMNLNIKAGEKFPRISSGFYIVFKKNNG